MEKVQVVDVDQRSSVHDDREEPIEDPCGHELVERRCPRAESCRPQGEESEPEQHRQPSEVGHADDGEYTSEAKHGQVANQTMEDGVLWYVPFSCLWDRGDDSHRTSKLGKEGRGRNDPKDEQLLRRGPVEGIIGVIAGLRYPMQWIGISAESVDVRALTESCVLSYPFSTRDWVQRAHRERSLPCHEVVLVTLSSRCCQSSTQYRLLGTSSELRR